VQRIARSVAANASRASAAIPEASMVTATTQRPGAVENTRPGAVGGGHVVCQHGGQDRGGDVDAVGSRQPGSV
jgi:hypothetical protein